MAVRKGSSCSASAAVGRNPGGGVGVKDVRLSFSAISFRESPRIIRMAEEDNQELDRALETLRRLGQN